MSVPAVLDRESSVAPWTYNRWLIPPAALAVHISIGQVYATSVYKSSLVSHFDTGQTPIGIIFSIAIVMLGISAAVGGTWVERHGPRKAMLVSALCWSGGFLVGALGIASQQLWLLYLGYGVIGGIGLGIGYISPVSTLIKWFPDRPGLATGLAIMGFGGGALLAAPVSGGLLRLYDPTFEPGTADSVASGVALVGLFVTLGLGYLVLMMMGVFLVRVPPRGWLPAGYEPEREGSSEMVTSGHVSAGTALRTPQFWLVWTVLFLNVTAGIGILEHASPMIRDFFRDGDTSAVTVAAAGGFVGVLSIFNMLGRFVWSSTSDVIGRKPTYMMFLGGGAVLYTLVATVGSTSIPLFVLLAGGIISFYGGGFATVPAYLRDLFGTYQVGAIHGRLLTAWSAAGIAGPLIINGFLDVRGEPGTLTQAAYQAPMFTMVGLLVVGFLANLAVRPVPAERHEPEESTREKREEGGGGATARRNGHDVAVGGQTFWLVLSWTIVAVLLGYGIISTAVTAAPLFV